MNAQQQAAPARKSAVRHLLSRGEEKPIDMRSGRSGGLRRYRYDLSDYRDFVTYMETSDALDGTRTWFANLTLDDICDMIPRVDFPAGYPHERLERLVELTFHSASRVCVSRESLDGIRVSDAPGRNYMRDEMQALHALHQLQQEERFVFPMSVLITPYGRFAVATGNTRLVFSGVRDETVPVMLTDYRIPDQDDIDASIWRRARDFDLGFPYHGIRMISRVFGMLLQESYGYVNYTRHTKHMHDIERQEEFTALFESRNSPARVFEAELRNDLVLIDGKPLCRREDGLWHMIPR